MSHDSLPDNSAGPSNPVLINLMLSETFIALFNQVTVSIAFLITLRVAAAHNDGEHNSGHDDGGQRPSQSIMGEACCNDASNYSSRRGI